MASDLAAWWAQLDDAVHPADRPVFDLFQDHEFDLSFPPPAFIGAVDTAPIVILDNNGGYDAVRTPSEFPDAVSRQSYRAALASPALPGAAGELVSPYYKARNFWHWLEDGTATLVNAVAYRSKDGKAKHVARLSRMLPSALQHRQWLLEVLLPQVLRNERFVVVHRWSRWNGATDKLRGMPNVVFSSAPLGADLTRVEREAVERWLSQR